MSPRADWLITVCRLDSGNTLIEPGYVCLNGQATPAVHVCLITRPNRRLTSALPPGQTGGSRLPYHQAKPAVHVCLTTRLNRLFTSALPTGQTGCSCLLTTSPKRLFTSALPPAQTGCSRLPCDLAKPAVDADDDPFTSAQMEKQLLSSHCCPLSGVNWMKLSRTE